MYIFVNGVEILKFDTLYSCFLVARRLWEDCDGSYVHKETLTHAILEKQFHTSIRDIAYQFSTLQHSFRPIAAAVFRYEFNVALYIIFQ